MLFLVLLALCLLTYFPCVYATPIWDDIQLFQDEDMKKWKFYRARLKDPRWITQMSFGLTFTFLQRVRKEWQNTMIVSAFHLTNILIHFLNSVLVYGIGSILVGDRAIVAALLFAVHPLCASAVAPIVSRSSILSTTFIFGAIWLTLAHYPFLALLLAVGAFWSKEDGIAVLPLILALTALYDPWTAFQVFGVCLLAFQRVSKRLFHMARTLLKNNGDISMVNAGLGGSLPQPLYTATAIVENLRRWPLWLLGFERNPDPDPKPRGVWPGISVSLLILVGCVLLLLSQQSSYLTIALIVLISPWSASWFFRLPDPVSELRAYSTVLGMALLLSYLPLPLVIPALIWFASLSAFRAWLQQNEMALWLHTWNEGSRKLRVALNLAAAYQKYNKIQEAYDWHHKALRISPKNGLVLTNLALWHEGRCRLERQTLSGQFVAEGRSDPKAVQDGIRKANEYLAQAVALAREGFQNCPHDPWVQHYSKKIEEHAEKIGMKVEIHHGPIDGETVKG